MGQEFEYDVFLSHSAKDKAVVRQLAERLRQDGLKVWFDKWEIKAGDNIPAMRSGVAFRWSALLDLGRLSLHAWDLAARHGTGISPGWTSSPRQPSEGRTGSARTRRDLRCSSADVPQSPKRRRRCDQALVGEPAQPARAVESSVAADDWLAIIPAEAGDPVIILPKPLACPDQLVVWRRRHRRSPV